MNTSPDTTAALEKIRKAAAGLHALYAPSVLEEAAELLADLWAAGERHGVAPKDWDWAVSLADGALDVVSRRHTGSPQPERTAAEVHALQRELIAALTSPEVGLTARLGPRMSIVVDRLPETPRGGLHGDADLAVGIYSNGGWDVSFDHHGASVVSIAAPATNAGAAEVAAIVHDIAHGRINPFRRDR